MIVFVFYFFVSVVKHRSRMLSDESLEIMSRYDRFGNGRSCGFEQKTGKRSHPKSTRSSAKKFQSKSHYRISSDNNSDSESDTSADDSYDNFLSVDIGVPITRGLRTSEKKHKPCYWSAVRIECIFEDEITGTRFYQLVSANKTARDVANQLGYKYIRSTRGAYAEMDKMYCDAKGVSYETFYVSNEKPVVLFTIPEIVKHCYLEHGVVPKELTVDQKIDLGMLIKIELKRRGMNVESLPRVMNDKGILIIRYDQRHYHYIYCFIKQWLKSTMPFTM